MLRRQIAGLKDWVQLDGRSPLNSIPPKVGRAPAHVACVSRLRAYLAVAVQYAGCLVYVNHVLSAIHIRQLYLGRADSENRIKELLQDFAISGFVSQKFWATEAAFRMALCAYNLMSLFRQSALGAASKHTLSTLRAQCFAIGASLGRVGHNQLLRLGLPATRRPWFEGLFSVVQALNIHTQLNRP
jgi:hypothetical protein